MEIARYGHLDYTSLMMMMMMMMLFTVSINVGQSTKCKNTGEQWLK